MKRSWSLWVTLTLLSLFASTAFAREPDFEGQPFVGRTKLAGTWKLSTEAPTPAEASRADLDTWSDVAVPGKWEGASFDDYRGLVWYGIDVRATPPSEWPTDGKLAVILPPFLHAYEAYAGTRRIGTSGQVGPPVESAPIVHEVFHPVPTDFDERGMVRLLVRANASRYPGTYSGAHIEAIALGTAGELRMIQDYVHRDTATRPGQLAGWSLSMAFIALAILHLILLVLLPERKEYLWYAVALLASGAGGIIEALEKGAVWPHDPTQQLVRLSLITIQGVAGALLVCGLFDVRGWMARAATIAPLLLGGWLALRLVFEAALASYREGALAIAAAKFEAVLTKFDDGASRLLMDDCKDHEEAPADWQGVTVLRSK